MNLARIVRRTAHSLALAMAAAACLAADDGQVPITVEAQPISDGVFADPAHAERQQARREIEDLIVRQVAAWNRGDLEGFCSEYTEDTIFISPSGLTRGREEVLARYLRRYPDRAAQGDLAIDILELATHDGTEVSLLDEARPGRVHSASVVGRWTLSFPEDTSKEPATGLTLLVLVKDDQGSWKILRDASM